MVKKKFKSYIAEKNNTKTLQFVQVINELHGNYQSLSDDQLRTVFIQLREKKVRDEKFRCYLFALVKEVIWRVFQIDLHNVQLMAGWVLADGKIAEMATGEGKTIMSVLPAIWYNVLGKKVHVMTVNEYLAKRDYEQMGKVFRFLGITVGLNLSEMQLFEKKQAYMQDVTYGVCNEFGFDYLRDHIAKDRLLMVQPALQVAIVDEVDSILIDEAKTPLIISEKQKAPPDIYSVCSKLVAKMEKEKDYELDLRTNQVIFTPAAIRKLEAVLMINNLYDGEHAPIFHFLLQSLKAHVFLKKDEHYIVDEDKIQLIDPFTGRILDGRQYNDGLHQAIEAKEGLPLSEENRVKATITIQKLFSLYETVVGMTGTIQVEEGEIHDLYGIEISVIPTHKPVIREDVDDQIFATKLEKYEAVLAEIKASHKCGQPVLVGTTSVAQSEHIADLLTKAGLPHQLLNAKTEKEEAAMIARAGEKGMITIATNMAGRGTDIVLGEGVADVGGLYVIGTEKHESRRIDRQLRGRAGRQGDPGKSKFFLSWEDELMVRFAGERTEKWKKSVKNNDLFEKIQKEVEEQNFAIRTIVFLLDSVIHDQRNLFYNHRRQVLVGEEWLETAQNHIAAYLENTLPTKENSKVDEIIGGEYGDYYEQFELVQKEKELWRERVKKLSPLQQRQLLQLYIGLLDEGWAVHLDTIHHLKQSLHSRVYEQRDPILIFHDEAWKLYKAMEEQVREALFHSLKELWEEGDDETNIMGPLAYQAI
ncbi:accessory Sec system translocase SecA2 [Schinkia azotoformans]|uniref:preprotein translocase subunit SecA n=1 Tax=Schinkia azotoformans TaxID=1454 RepID=UPI002E1B0896|nr:accessory Sec system translocase SecA2 [Schinkia azotoformans]